MSMPENDGQQWQIALSETRDPWEQLRSLTPARIALGRAGASLPTQQMLDFQLAHARARDAVHSPFRPEELKGQVEALGQKCIIVNTAAEDRKTYLLRPDLGRKLSEASRQRLQEELPPSPTTSPCLPPLSKGRLRGGSSSGHGCDLALILSDGLSALALHRQGPAVLSALLPLLQNDGWHLAPIIIALNGRVALQDEIGELLGATLGLILIGERPGLAAPDSLGAYMTYAPRIGRTDADRNCVSNIRPEGLPPGRAALKLHYLLTQSRRHRISGVPLKDESDLLITTTDKRTTDLTTDY